MEKTKNDWMHFWVAIIISLIGFTLMAIIGILQSNFEMKFGKTTLIIFFCVTAAMSLIGAIMAIELWSKKWWVIKKAIWNHRWMIVLLILVMAGLFIITPIEEKALNSDVLKACSAGYDNETFMDNFVQDEPYVPARCEKLLNIKQVSPYEKDPYLSCIQEDPFEYYFITHCGWMMPDYLILVGIMIGNMFVLMMVFAIISVIYNKFKKRPPEKNINTGKVY